MGKRLEFPKNFLWGTAISAYQSEGGINCDWTKHFDAGLACNHYHLYEKDFDLAKSLNQNAFRFSIEWSRIEPKEGKFDQTEIEFYRNYLRSLKARGFATMVTLHHFTNPVWLADIGGWTNKKVVFYFTRFAQKMFGEYRDLVDFWITINEPLIYATFAYSCLRGDPERKKDNSFRASFHFRIFSLIHPFLIIKNQILAHKKVYKIFHQIVGSDSRVRVGIAKNNTYFDAFNFNSSLDKLSMHTIRYLWNEYFLNRTKHHLDFIGLNYYFHNRIKFPFKIKNQNEKINDLGWEICSPGIYYVLKELKKYNLPIYITENGLADKNDALRKDFIKDHLCWTWQAIEEGVDIRGYFHWSLIDNFEWDKAREPRFGLVEVDYSTFERKPRPSAFYYAKICKENALML